MRIASLSLRSFRGFRDASVQLDRGTLLIGANDVGKSTVLEAIRFILDDRAATNGRWSYEQLASVSSDLDVPVEPVVVVAELEDPDAADREQLGDLLDEGRLLIGRYLLPATGSPVGWNAPHDRHVLVPAGSRRLEDSEVHWGRAWLLPDSVDVPNEALRRAVPTCVHFPPPDDPPASMVDLLEPLLAAQLLRRLEATGVALRQLGEVAASIQWDVGDRLNASLPRYLPDVHELYAEMDWDTWDDRMTESLSRTAFGTLALFVRRKGQGETILGRPADVLRPLGPSLGGGARRLAALACLELYLDPELWEGDRSVVLAIEEPEAGVHPEAQRRVADLLRQLPSANVQTVVVTHSPVFINAAAKDGLRLVRASSTSGVDPMLDAESDRRQEVVIPEGLAEIAAELGVSPADLVQASLFVIVEGTSDAAIIGTWCRAAGIDPEYRGVRLIPGQGAGDARRIVKVTSMLNPTARHVLVLDAGTQVEREERLLRKESGERVAVFRWHEDEIEHYLALPAVERWLVGSGVAPSKGLTERVAALGQRPDRKRALNETALSLLRQDYRVVEDGRKIAFAMQPPEFGAEVRALLDIIRSAADTGARGSS